MKRLLRVLVVCVLFLGLVSAQTATVKRNVNLRPNPSTDNKPIATLKPAAQLNLVEPDEVDGYFHVETSAGQEGWVWGKNVHIESGGTNSSGAGRIGPPPLYPDRTMTPGEADTLEASDLTKRYTTGCPSGKKTCTYSQAHRNVPKNVHTKVYDEYNVPEGERNIQHGEVDHFYPLCAGGSNDITNLWYQPKDNEWNGQNFGFHEKDKLETYVCAQIKAGKMDPKDAFDRIKKDWVKFYLDQGLDAED